MALAFYLVVCMKSQHKKAALVLDKLFLQVLTNARLIPFGNTQVVRETNHSIYPLLSIYQRDTDKKLEHYLTHSLFRKLLFHLPNLIKHNREQKHQWTPCVYLLG